MKLKLSHFSISVKEMFRSIKFYRDVIGCKVLYETDMWSELEFDGGVEISLKKVTTDEKIGWSGIGFEVDDCELETVALENKGIKMLTRCEKREKEGIVLTQFTDPDGNIIWLSERKK